MTPEGKRREHEIDGMAYLLEQIRQGEQDIEYLRYVADDGSELLDIGEIVFIIRPNGSLVICGCE